MADRIAGGSERGMSDRFSVAELRQIAESEFYALQFVGLQVPLMALLDAVEAAYELVRDEDTIGLVRLMEPLRQALTRFDFGEPDRCTCGYVWGSSSCEYVAGCLVGGPRCPGCGKERQRMTADRRDFYELHPGCVVDVVTAGSWTRNYRSSRRWFKTRVYWLRLRLPVIAWRIFVGPPTLTGISARRAEHRDR